MGSKAALIIDDLQLTAGDWNRAGGANNRLEIRLH